MKIKKIRMLLLCTAYCSLYPMDLSHETQSTKNVTSENIEFIDAGYQFVPDKMQLFLDKTNNQTNNLTFVLHLGTHKPEGSALSTAIFKKNGNTIQKSTDTTPPPQYVYKNNNITRRVQFEHKKLLISGSHIKPTFVTHSTPVITYGVIEDTLFSGSVWPAIKKTTLARRISTTPFIENAFLLACRDNGMVIAKINEENNGWFWVYRRFGKPYNCTVTLYALFFDQEKITTLTQKEVEHALKEARNKKLKMKIQNRKGTELKKRKNVAASDNQNEYISKDAGITVLTLAENITLIDDTIHDPEKWLMRAAINQDSTIVVYTPTPFETIKNETDTIDPFVFFAFKEGNEWRVPGIDLHTELHNLLGTEQIKKATYSYQVPFKYNRYENRTSSLTLRHPTVNNIEHMYLYTHHDAPYALIVSHNQKSQQRPDCIYEISLNKHPENHFSSLVWHAPINHSVVNENSTWNIQEEIMASTFDYAQNILYFVTRSRNEPTVFKLYTYKVNNPTVLPSSTEKVT